MVQPANPGMKGTPNSTASPELEESQSDPEQTTERKSERSNPSVREIGGPKGPEPTRYGDWERNGRCIDF